MMAAGYDYGRGGIVGIGTPQANPTVEAEMRILLPPAILPVTVRLACGSPDPAERLRAYLRELPATLERFDSLKPACFGFACTASSYLVPRKEAGRIFAAIEDRFGYPVVTAADAIAAKLDQLGARRVALVSPYPEPLASAAAAYWTQAGFQIVPSSPIPIGGDDTRGIYRLGSGDARRALDALAPAEFDAILLSGTGMPSLSLVGQAKGTPVISSNFCLAEALVARASGSAGGLGDWQGRLGAATGATDTDGNPDH